MKLKCLALILSYVFFNSSLNAQNPSDCTGAVTICGNSSINFNVSGIGIQELAGSNTCASQENNSIWLQVTLVNNGTLAFTLRPESTDLSEDYDFFIFGPNPICGNLGVTIRCSTTNPLAAGASNNLTGLRDTEGDVAEGPGGNGNSFVRSIDGIAGETYFIVIDRPIGNSPFNIEWTGTATFAEPPADQSVLTNSTIDLEQCDVIAPYDDESTEFELTDNDNLIIGNQTDVTVTYHISETEALTGANALLSPYTNISNPQIIYARITNDQTDCFDTTEFSLTVTTGPSYIPPTFMEICDDDLDGDNSNGQAVFDLSLKDIEILNGQNPASLNITYYGSLIDAENETNPLTYPNYYNTTPNQQEIFVRVEDVINPLCSSISSIELFVNVIPDVLNAYLFQCDEDGTLDGLTLFNLTEANDELTGGLLDRSTKFYLTLIDAQNDTNEIDGTSFSNTASQQIIYVRVFNESGNIVCYNISELFLDVTVTDALDAQLQHCDDDGTEDGFYNFDLTLANADILNGLPPTLTITYYETYDDALLEQNTLGNSFTNTTPYLQTIYARVENANACYGISQIDLTVFELPIIDIEDDALYCLNFFPQPITLNAGLINNAPTDFTYLWSTGETTEEILVNQPGTYSVTVTNNNNCSKDRSIIVNPSNIATIENIEVVDATSNNTITILVSGEGDYEYALDFINGPYQDSNTFENVPPGLHTVYIRDKNDCGIVDDIVSVIGFPKFFTPNGDSYNDTWQVYGINDPTQFESIIYIFDRYGKLLKQLSPQGAGWDGTFNGEQLPTNDYWFHVTLQDGRVFKNHFTLKR